MEVSTFIKFVLGAACLTACASLTVGVPRKIASLEESEARRSLPNQHALKNWARLSDYETGEKIPLEQLPRISLSCKDKNLYPTHPQQSTKIYHYFYSANYDHFRLSPHDEACAQSAKSTPGVKQRCLRGDSAHHAIISDLYRDSCGNLYRAVWEVVYLASNESMGTLSSRGRTMYQNPKSEFENDLITGATYILAESDFLFLTEPFSEDVEKVNRHVEQARLFSNFDEKSGIFHPKE